VPQIRVPSAQICSVCFLNENLNIDSCHLHILSGKEQFQTHFDFLFCINPLSGQGTAAEKANILIFYDESIGLSSSVFEPPKNFPVMLLFSPKLQPPYNSSSKYGVI
jgi:hypothetical protein